MSRPFIILDSAHFSKMYNDGDIKLSMITSHFDVSIGTIQKNRNYLSLPLRNKRIEYDEKEFMRLFQDGETYENMAEKLGMSRCSVIVIRKHLGLPARNQRQEKARDEH